jgi:hypothetical protein
MLVQLGTKGQLAIPGQRVIKGSLVTQAQLEILAIRALPVIRARLAAMVFQEIFLHMLRDIKPWVASILISWLNLAQHQS